MRFYILIGIIFSACTSNQSSNQSSTEQADEIRKMMAEDSFKIDTLSAHNSDDLNEVERKALMKIALKPLKPSYALKDLKIDKTLEVYSNLLKTIERYQDSEGKKQTYLDTIFEELEQQNKLLELENEYPIELKLNVASIKSDIHLLRSNRQIKLK